MRDARDQYLGVYTSRRLKLALQREARRNSVSLSRVVNCHLAKALGLPVGDLEPDARGNAGRRASRRVNVTQTFRDALLASCQSKKDLAQTAKWHLTGIDRVFRGDVIVLTDKTARHLRLLAQTVGYSGPVVE